jgi:predicted RecA/RadA family phage recombinase
MSASVNSQNFLHSGLMMPFTAPSGGVVAGTPYLIGSLLVIAQETVAAGASFDGLTTGVFVLPKATGQAWTEGLKLYWDNTAKNVTSTVGSNTLVGVAAVAAASADTTGKVRIDAVVR